MVLEALFNGGIYASENVVPKSDSFRQATEEIARIMTFFEGKLPPEDYALLEKLCDRHADEGNITNEVQWEIREINEIMNNSIEGWTPFSNPRIFAKYGRQRGWERTPTSGNELSATGSNLLDGFRELTEEEARQMELPF